MTAGSPPPLIRNLVAASRQSAADFLPKYGSALTIRRYPTYGIARHRDPYYSGFMQTISLKLPDALLRQLQSEARLRRVTVSHLVRASLEKALAGGKEGARVSCYDLARDLAGKVKGLPKDLATNPVYLKGFGQ